MSKFPTYPLNCAICGYVAQVVQDSQGLGREVTSGISIETSFGKLKLKMVETYRRWSTNATLDSALSLSRKSPLGLKRDTCI